MTNSRVEHLAAELRAARRHRNLTQAQLADAAGVSVWAINRIERCAATRIDTGQVIALAEALDIESKDLVPSLAEDGTK
ncbi:helix-turn-helix domain-containing protein [Nocardia sp. NPDC055165]